MLTMLSCQVGEGDNITIVTPDPDARPGASWPIEGVWTSRYHKLIIEPDRIRCKHESSAALIREKYIHLRSPVCKLKVMPYYSTVPPYTTMRIQREDGLRTYYRRDDHEY